MRAPLLSPDAAGLACPEGGFHVDPWRPVPRAVITHAHADHARGGSDAYLCTPGTAAMLRQRLGTVQVQEAGWGEPVALGAVTVSFHPAGHVPGSAQLRVARAGEVWVVSGDYKTAPDGLSEAFEPVACDTFVSECTFGLPVFRWPDQGAELARIRDWWAGCAAAGVVPVLGAYSLGKAQRLIAGLAGAGPIAAHPAVEGASAALRAAGYPVPDTLPAAPPLPPGALVIAPPAALAGGWAGRFGPASTAFASGWMAIRGLRRRRGAERGFVLSDHADWPGLNAAIRATGAARVLLTHGTTAAFARYLAEGGLEAGALATAYAGESLDEAGA